VDVFSLDNVNGVLNARFDVLGFKLGIVIADYGLEGNAIADQLQYHLHGHARACHARFAKVDRGADLYSTHGLTLHPSMLARQAGLCRLLSCAARRRIHEFRGQAFSANSPLGANAKIDFETTTRVDLPVHPGECSSASSAPDFRAKAKRQF